MTPSRFKELRQRTGLSQSGLAAALRLRHGGKAVRDFENGTREISGPVAVAMEYMCLYGILPPCNNIT
jgi:DNA-binding transcriptional regulator YiaG